MGMTLRLPPADDRVLIALAKAQGISKHEAALRAIRETAARVLHEKEVAALSEAARSRYAHLLDRLKS